jgi:glutathione synthase/RimK-type ligase-like ATP-grasp enzyme
VDILQDPINKNLMVIDVNSSPGWSAFKGLNPDLNLEQILIQSLFN